MKRAALHLIASTGLIFAFAACTSSSTEPEANAAQAINPGSNAAGGAPATNEPANVDSSVDQTAAGGTTATGGAVAAGGAPSNGTGGKATQDGKGPDASIKTDKDAAVIQARDAAATKPQPTEAERKLLDMIASKKTYDAATIDPLYDQLDTIPSEFLIGTWKGHVFEANPSNPNNWYGKRVAPDLTAEPWLTNLPDGGPGPNSVNPFLGNPSTIQQEEFRGKTSAVLVYNNQTNRDYFRKITGDLNHSALDDIVIGYSSSQSKYFYLVRTFL